MEVKAFAVIPHSNTKGVSVEMEIKLIVLCKYCKHYDEEFVFCKKIGIQFMKDDGNWYCADGEPKEG